jgi:hypothetical protein
MYGSTKVRLVSCSQEGCANCFRGVSSSCTCGRLRRGYPFCICPKPRFDGARFCFRCSWKKRTNQQLIDCKEFHVKITDEQCDRHWQTCYGCGRGRSYPTDCLQEEWDRRRGNRYLETRSGSYFRGREKGTLPDGSCGLCAQHFHCCQCFK